jgi:hypothetical protein
MAAAAAADRRKEADGQGREQSRLRAVQIDRPAGDLCGAMSWPATEWTLLGHLFHPPTRAVVRRGRWSCLHGCTHEGGHGWLVVRDAVPL